MIPTSQQGQMGRFFPDPDPYWDKVLFLVPPEGHEGDTAFPDAKDSAGWTAPLGAVTVDEDFGYFGKSILFDGGGGYLAHVGSGLNLDNTACTIDGPVRFRSGTRATVEQCWLSKWQPATSTSQSFLLFFNAASTSVAPNAIHFDWRAGSSTYVSRTASFTFAFDADYWVEVNWDGGNTLRFFVDGQLIATHTVTMNFNQSSLDFWMGRLNHSSVACRMNANAAPLRVTNGVARHTGDYEPPTMRIPTF